MPEPVLIFGLIGFRMVHWSHSVRWEKRQVKKELLKIGTWFIFFYKPNEVFRLPCMGIYINLFLPSPMA
ncbi:MAG: hypothetical protein D3924_10495 [Candidatus Electrothrix sp. AR4]|nr:hypothetical protein [Candidatus Electrothrix sp. AR4]